MGLDIVIQILKGTDGTQFAHRNLDFIRLLNQSDQIDQAQAVKLERIADVGIRSKTSGIHLKFFSQQAVYILYNFFTCLISNNG